MNAANLLVVHGVWPATDVDLRHQVRPRGCASNRFRHRQLLWLLAAVAACLLGTGCVQHSTADEIDPPPPPPVIDIPENLPGVVLTVSPNSYAEIQSWLGESNTVTLARAHKVVHSEISLDLAANTSVTWECGATSTLIKFAPLPKITSSAIAKLLGLTLTSLQINADGSGVATVDGFHRGFRWDVRTDSAASAVCPCCGVTGVCHGLCGKAGCTCPRGDVSAAPIAGNSAALPQFVTQYQWQQRCKPNGQCDWVSVPVQVPLSTNGGGTSAAAMTKRLAAPSTQGGRITIYDNGSPAGAAMRNAVGSKGVDWKNAESPIAATDGFRWSPTAVKTDSKGNVISSWTPGANGWIPGVSDAQYSAWLRGQQ